MFKQLFVNRKTDAAVKDYVKRLMVKPHTSDIRMTYESSTCELHADVTYKYIRVTYRWHTSTYEWHTDDIWVHTSDIRMTCEWHTDDMRFEIYLFWSFLIILIQNIWFEKNSLHAMAVFGYLPKLKMVRN